MQYPVHRDADRAPSPDADDSDEGHGTADAPLDNEWQEGAAAFPLAYAYPEDAPAPDYAASQEATDIEAALLSDLEAAATAFWTDIDGDETAAGAEAEHDGAYDPPEEYGNRNEFRWPEPNSGEFVGPEIRRTLIAFRPPRRRGAARADAGDTDFRAVNFDVHATSDGAFADDLAARNKEFYELLKSGGGARKIAVPAGPARGPGFETIFPRAEPAPRHRQARAKHAGSGLARQAAAAAILAIVVGVGVFVIGQQFSIPAGSDDAASLLADSAAETSPTVLPHAVAAASAARDAEAGTAMTDDRTTATVPTVDPGTLTTPPLYETAEPTGSGTDFSEPALSAPEIAAVPLRGTGTPADYSAPSPAPSDVAADDLRAADAGTAPTAPEPLALEDPAAEDAASATPPKPERESVTIAAAKPTSEQPPTDNSRTQRIAAGTGKVNTSVNMRAGPDNDAKVVRVLRAGTQVEILNSCKFWCEVIAGGDRGFVYQRFISRTGGGGASSNKDPAPAEKTAQARDEAGGPLDLLRFRRSSN